MHLAEHLPAIRGHWLFEVFDGDVERRPLTPEQVAENGVWAKVSPGSPPLHVGAIVSRPIDAFEGDNLVTTVGKGLLLDRLYALGTPPTAVNSMGVGTVSTAAAIGDTQMNQGGGGSSFLQALDSLSTRAGLVVTSVCTYATGVANFAWAETGLFNGVTNGTSLLFNRIAPIGPFTKSAAVSIAVTQTVQQS